jgi:hypothetical protein
LYRLKNEIKLNMHQEELVYVNTKRDQYWPAKSLYRWKKENGKEIFQVVLYGTYERFFLLSLIQNLFSK